MTCLARTPCGVFISIRAPGLAAGGLAAGALGAFGHHPRDGKAHLGAYLRDGKFRQRQIAAAPISDPLGGGVDCALTAFDCDIHDGYPGNGS